MTDIVKEQGKRDKLKKELRIIKATYTASAVKESQYPEGDTIEVAFLGRSNVGKSSLINSLCDHRGLAMVSKQPGKTKTINFFSVTSKKEIDEDHELRYEWFLVDLPGYGFAKTKQGNKDRGLWAKFIADYISTSPRLALLCLLIDGRHPDSPLDRDAFAWLKSVGVPLQIIVTKTDKLKSGERQKNMKVIKERFPTERPPIAYSSLTHTGRALVMQQINALLEE